jgi:putative endopeptidase
MKKAILFTAAGALLLSACSHHDKKAEQASSVPDPIIQHIDSSISPKEDFFRFANNTWFKQNPIPSTESNNGLWKTIQDTLNQSIRKICESSAADSKAAKGSNKQKIGDFYFSGMDTASIEKAGITPLAEDMAKIDAIKNIADLLAETARMQTMAFGPLYGFAVTRDDKNSEKYVVGLYQVGLGLPERDYYFNTDALTVSIRKEYVKHVKAMFQLVGTDEKTAEKNANTIMTLETTLAKSCRKMEDLRDPYKNYNKMSVAQVNKLIPTIKWDETLQTLGLKNVDSIVVGQPEFFTSLETNLKKIPLADWKLYLKWNLIDGSAVFLNKAIVSEDFNFNSTVLNGITKQKPRWKKMVKATDGMLGDLIGQVYVEEYCPKGTKEKLLEIGNNIRDVYAEHIKTLDWMSDVTKQKALSKLNKITMKVGYPDKWKDLSSLEICRDSYAKNVMNVMKWRYNYMLSKYGKPVDRTEWDMQPQTYNAYYNPANNEIVVPACNIMVPGFEGRMPDDAVLYGIIGGSTFGHEITHGFDDQGSKYDEKGNLADWWTKEDKEKFEAKTKLIVRQFDNYVVLDSLHLKGANSQGENIADLGGVIMGFEAFKKTKQGQSKDMIEGYTPEQRYFLAYAYAWMVNNTDASLAKQIMSNEHAPPAFRVNGPLADVEEFYKAFDVKKGDKMYREDSVRVKIW